ncbi:hypothetical protein Cgig2_028407 [Carnegiea gigantea]|uniref:F-box protein n=1 Tax=Carnegiea gigantea TaxID=171969 RepID=A0A9Q1K141_9CARY|nr:hypothetical protein Cgig2_028407 [Carnegiea gigantea]
MDGLPVELGLKIFSFLDYHNLAIAQQVCRKWRTLASDDILWANLFNERWGEDQALFYAPDDSKSKSWKDVYEIQHRCDRVGLGLKIIREGMDYYLIHRGEIQRYLGSRRQRKREDSNASTLRKQGDGHQPEGGPSNGNGNGNGILDKILFFIADMEVATLDAKRNRCM